MPANRKNFIKIIFSSVLGFNFLPNISKAKNINQLTISENPKLDVELVKSFVASCHGNFVKVKELYEKEPLLIFSSHDWGNGDFENGIEAAGHTGHPDIVQFLLEKGARINFFTLCMLGDLETVSKLLKDFPFMVNAKGPHGLTPLHHAIQGGEKSAEIKKLLEKLGATETKIKL